MLLKEHQPGTLGSGNKGARHLEGGEGGQEVREVKVEKKPSSAKPLPAELQSNGSNSTCQLGSYHGSAAKT